MNAIRTGPRRVVHLELHTGDRVRAGAFYAELLQWRPELVRAGSGCYLAVDLGPAVGGGITECQTRRPLWLPYAEVERIDDATEHARRLGATVLLEPREGPSARNGGQDASARLVRPCLAQPRACCHRMLRPHFAQDTGRWISGPARITTSEATDPAGQRGATK